MLNTFSKLPINNFFYYLSLLLPIAFVSGPFLSDSILSLIAIYGLFIFIFNRSKLELEKFDKIILFSLFFLSIYFVIRSFFTNFIFISLESSLFYFRYPFFIIGFLYLLKINQNLLINFSKIIIFLIFLFFIDVFYEFLFDMRVFGNNSPGKNYGRYSSFFGDELIMGTFIYQVFIFGLIFLLKIKNIFSKVFIILYFLSTLFIIYFSGQRVAFFNFTIMTFIIFLLPIFSFKKKLITLILIVATLFSFTYVNSESTDRMYKSTIKQIFDNKGNIRIFSELHELHYITGIKFFIDNPLFGQGPKSFRILCDQNKFETILKKNYSKDEKVINGCSTHPHQHHIQLLSETGIIGYLGFLIIFFTILFNIYSKRHSKNFINILILSLPFIITFIPITPSNNFFNNWHNILYYLPIPLIMYCNSIK